MQPNHDCPTDHITTFVEDWKPPARNGAAMLANEYCMAMNYKTILSQAIDLEPRDLVAEVCGVGKNTAQKALSKYENKRIPEDSLTIKRPKLELENDYVANVRESF
ncbi:hypothetical protein BJV82DRAFT_578641 [Fennellomyces sp. T-0311]|nr:hypothetical protein BJV82DRAFT_578641 [Fennellomyces sp. T-0311]